MNVVLPKTNNGVAKRPPILPLVREETKKKVTKENSLALTLRINPSQNASPTYQSVVMHLHGTESPRETIECVRTIRAAWVGLNIDGDGSHANQKLLVERILKDGALDAFNASIERQLDQAFEEEQVAYAAGGAVGAAPVRATATTKEQNIQGLRDVIANIVPPKALQQVKRYLRRECRKPQDMQVRHFYSNLRRINKEEIPELPPFDPDQGLSDDEVVDILLYAVPKSWVKEMDRQGIEPFDMPPIQVVEFFERLEATEDFTPVKSNKDKSSKDGKDKSSKKNKTCVLHGPGHSTDECRTLKAQAKKRKSDDGGRGGDKKSGQDWKKKAGTSTNLSKKELKLLIQKQARAELKSFQDKKRKSDTESSDDDDKDDASLNAFDMEAFSYKDMEGLELEDKKPTAKASLAKKAAKKDEPDSMDEFKLSDDSDDDTVMTEVSA